MRHPGGEVSLRLELLEEGAEEERGEEEDDGPEEDVGDVGPVVTAGLSRELSVEQVTHLERQRQHNVTATLLLLYV